LNSEPDSNQ